MTQRFKRFFVIIFFPVDVLVVWWFLVLFLFVCGTMFCFIERKHVSLSCLLRVFYFNRICCLCVLKRPSYGITNHNLLCLLVKNCFPFEANSMQMFL